MNRCRCHWLPGLLLGLLSVVSPVWGQAETELYDDAMGLMGQHKFAEAAATFKKSVTADPRYKEAWEGLAEAWKALGKAALAAAAQAQAAAAPAARAGDAPPLTDLQRRILAEDLGGPAVPTPPVPPPPPAQPGQPPQPPPPAVPPGGPLVAPPAQPAEPLKPLPALAAVGPDGKPKPMVKLDKFAKSQYCDVAVAGDGTIHAIFTDRPDGMKASYLYYRASHDNGATWSEPKNLSDDESGLDAGYCQTTLDGAGRVYAVWKYVPKNVILDGPGGDAGGLIVYRCLEGGAWSRTVRLNPKETPAYSWFLGVGHDGAVHLVWSQMAAEAMKVLGWATVQYADLVLDARLDGATLSPYRTVVGPAPLPTPEQVKAAQAAGHPFRYEETRPKQDGLVNLRGFLDDHDVVHFVAEDPGIKDGPTPQQTGQRVVLFDGTALRVLHTFARFSTHNNFNNPPMLLTDAKHHQHVLRVPENAEMPAVRDYTVDGGELADPVDVVSPNSPKGTILNWQAWQVADGRMCVTAAISQKGGQHPDDAELYVTFSDGDGKWLQPVCVTSNEVRAKTGGHDFGNGRSAATMSLYRPKFASVALLKDGHPAVLMVDNEESLLLAAVPGNTGGAAIGFGSDNPSVFFLKL